MIIFRPHRSSLDETMKEAKEFDDVEKMKEYIVELWNRKWHGSQKLFTTDDIVINKESALNDDRIEWEVRFSYGSPEHEIRCMSV